MRGDFSSQTIADAFANMASDQVTITRRTGSLTSFAIETIYQGAGDLQERDGSMFYGAGSGAPIERVDALLILSFPKPFIWDQSNEDDGDQMDAVPQVQAGDLVERAADQRTYTVVGVQMHIWQLYHLEIQLQRGGIKKQAP